MRLVTKLGPVLPVYFLSLAMGCATATKEVKTPYFTLAHPDYWEVKSVGMADGEPTFVVIGSYGSAVIDEGVGAMEAREANYEAVQADVEVRAFGWDGLPPEIGDPTSAVARLLNNEPTLQLGRQYRVPEQPLECNILHRKYKLLGEMREPLDLVSRPGHRLIVVGARSGDTLIGVVSRVEFEQDVARYCHNLRNMQVQMQNFLDGIRAMPASGGGAGAAPAAGAGEAAGAAPAAGAGESGAAGGD